MSKLNFDYNHITEIIINVFEGKNLVNIFNEQSSKIDNISKAKDICFGVFRNYFIINQSLNYLISEFENLTIKAVLFIGIYEIKYTTKAQHAIVNDLVNLVKSSRYNSYASFINGVLRNYIRTQDELHKRSVKHLEYVFNMPKWIIDRLKSTNPHNYKQIIECLNKKPLMGLRVNQNKISIVDYIKQLNEFKIEYKIYNNHIILIKNYKVSEIPFFNEGYVSIQDIAAQELINLLDLSNQYKILDCCAAPGGKTAQILELYDAKITAIDIEEKRLNKIHDNLSRLNLQANLVVGDARLLNWWNKELFDIVIADVPCSASGTIKRNPDIKVNRTQEDIKNFVEIQKEIVLNVWNTLKIGGQFLYITCSIFTEENQGNIEYFKQNIKGFNVVKDLIINPNDFRDGFYYCLVKKEF